MCHLENRKIFIKNIHAGYFRIYVLSNKRTLKENGSKQILYEIGKAANKKKKTFIYHVFYKQRMHLFYTKTILMESYVSDSWFIYTIVPLYKTHHNCFRIFCAFRLNVAASVFL